MPLGGKGLVNEIVFADRSAARGDENIGRARARVTNSHHRFLEVIPDEPEIDHGGALLTRQRGERETVRIHNLSRSGFRAGRHQFVAGGEERDCRAPMHRYNRMVHAGDERQVARGEPMACREQAIAAAKVEALPANVAALAHRL